MSWNKKFNMKQLREKAEKAVVINVEKELDRIRDIIFSEAQKMGGWNSYIFNLQKQKGLIFVEPKKP